MIFKKLALGLGFLFFFGWLSSCSDDDGQMNCNPQYTISASINVALPLYSELESKGWTYVGGEGTGTKGLIVVKNSNGTYKAYDRNAPHICPTANSQLIVVEDIKIQCPEDGAEWILLTGQPLQIADRSPRTYMAVRNGNIVTIFNQ
jgi:nitrite reductase/ring-hydroxylating ferredoxin subunit